jgi:L-ascorbate metabolism protein UlaG (beta-lactamase superfamily)
LFILFSLGQAVAQSPPATNAPPRALPVNPADLTNAAPQVDPMPLAVPGGVNVHWYGHGFVYLTSSVGVRAAIDPFGTHTVQYKFPSHLTADFILISHEAEDHAASELLFGSPLIFRSVTAVGLNRANGIPFHGVALQKDSSGRSGSTTAFTLSFDGVSFCYIGQIYQPLLGEEKQELGHADVVFLPIGLTTLSVNDFNDVVRTLGARVIIPVNYKTDKSGDLPLRTLDEYLAGSKFPVRKFESDEMVVTRSMLPTEPTVYLLKSP